MLGERFWGIRADTGAPLRILSRMSGSEVTVSVFFPIMDKTLKLR